MTDLSPFFPLLEAYAPTIGGLLAGPVGARVAPLAVAGIHALADALDLDGDERTAPAVAQKLNEMPTAEVPAVLKAAEAFLKAALPQPATPAPVQLPAPVAPPAPAQGLYVDPANSLIKLGVAVVAGFAAAKFGIDATTATNVLTPIAEFIVALGVIGAMAFSQWRSVFGANANTAAAMKG